MRIASVTIPLKVDVIQHGLLDSMSDSATKIGSVNTIVKTEQGTLWGDNTDWLGIKASFESCMEQYHGKKRIGVVLGAGGVIF